jgi:acyl-CoA reductase-like NAD-dependent aldehyde dehydrogenase
VTLTVLNPATEEPIAELEQAGIDEADAAVARARAAYPAWRAVAPADRARLLRRLATLVEEHVEDLARIESQNVGKPIAGARGEKPVDLALVESCLLRLSQLVGDLEDEIAEIDLNPLIVTERRRGSFVVDARVALA